MPPRTNQSNFLFWEVASARLLPSISPLHRSKLRDSGGGSSQRSERSARRSPICQKNGIPIKCIEDVMSSGARRPSWPNRRRLRSDDKMDEEREMERERERDKKERENEKEEENNAPLAFFKVMYIDFKEFLFIPPKMAPRLEHFSGCDVYLEDLEGNSSKIRMSVVDGSLALCQGWNDFVSAHSIKSGELLLFQYTGKSIFSVRVFGMDACERVCRHVETESKRGRKKRKEHNASLDNLRPPTRSRNANDKCCRYGEDRKSKEPEEMVDGTTLANGKIAHSNSVDEAMDVAPRTPQVSVNTIEDGKWPGLSTAPNYTVCKSANGECEANSISSQHHQENTKISETVVIIDSAPAMQENESTLKAAPASHQKEGRNMTREPEHEAAAPAQREQIHDSNEDLRRKSEKNLNSSEPSAAVDNGPVDNSKPSAYANVSGESKASGGCRCLEKILRKRNIMGSQASLGGCGLSKVSTPEKPQKTDNDLLWKKDVQEKRQSEIDNHGKLGRRSIFTNRKDIPCDAEETTPEAMAHCLFLNNKEGEGMHQILDEKLAGDGGATRATKHQYSGKKIAHCNDRKGATAELQEKREHLKQSVAISQKDMLPLHTTNVIARKSDAGNHFSQEEDRKSTCCATSVAFQPVKVEILDFDDMSFVKSNFCFCIPSTTHTWIELPKLTFNVIRQRRQNRNVIMLKDPMKRLWPILYHQNTIFVGFTVGWKPFVTANNLHIGDICELFRETSEEESIYRVHIIKK